MDEDERVDRAAIYVPDDVAAADAHSFFDTGVHANERLLTHLYPAGKGSSADHAVIAEGAMVPDSCPPD